MELKNYILEILQLQGQVGLPLLGTLSYEWQSAKIDNDHILAPKKTLTFNANNPDWDGYFIHYISKQKHLGFEDAKEWLHQECQNIMAEIHQNGECTLVGLGRWIKEPDGFILFHQDAQSLQKDLALFQNVKIPNIKPEALEMIEEEKNHQKQIKKSIKLKIFKTIGLLMILILFILAYLIYYYPDLFGNLISDKTHQWYHNIIDVIRFTLIQWFKQTQNIFSEFKKSIKPFVDYVYDFLINL